MTTYKEFVNLCDSCVKCLGSCNSNPKFLIDKQDLFNKPIPEKFADLVYDCDGYTTKFDLKDVLIRKLQEFILLEDIKADEVSLLKLFTLIRSVLEEHGLGD